MAVINDGVIGALTWSQVNNPKDWGQTMTNEKKLFVVDLKENRPESLMMPNGEIIKLRV